VGRDIHQPPAFGQPLEHQFEVAVLQVAEAAVNQLRRTAGGLAGEVAGVAQGDVEAAQGGVARDAGAGRPAADDQDVDRARLAGRVT
jgi:hypothetical protein